MKFTRILKMLLVLALSTSITSCDEFFAIFDDPVPTTDPVTPPEPDPDTPTPPETILPTDEELKANALRILAEIQKDGALFCIYYILDEQGYVATFKHIDGKIVYQEPTTSARRRESGGSGEARGAVEAGGSGGWPSWEVPAGIVAGAAIFVGGTWGFNHLTPNREASVQFSINMNEATYSQVTPVLADGSQVNAALKGIALMKDGTALEDVPKTMPDAAKDIKKTAGAVEGIIWLSKEDIQSLILDEIIQDPTMQERIGLVDQVSGDGKVHGTDLTLGNADAGEAGQNMKVGETKNLSAQVIPTNATAGNIPVYQSSDEKVVTVDDKGNVTAVGAGSANITGNLPDIPASTKGVTINVEKTSASISYLVPEYDKYWSPTPDDNTVTYLVTNTGDGVVTYAVQDGSNTCGAIVDPETGKVTFTKAGKATIIATTSSTNTYTYEGDDATASYTLTIHKIDGSISFATSEVNKTNTDAAFTNTLTNTGDGTVTYSSDKTSVAKVDASTGEVTIMGVGNAIITATVEDGTNYTYPTKSVTYKLNISANPSILDKPTGYGQGDNPF